MIGTTLGHFKVIAKIGEGASGVVYRAEDEALRRQVALEVLSPALASDPGHKARFLSAARAAAAVTHPNLAAIHEVGESDGRVWVAMELVEGDTLRSRLRGRPLPLLETLRIGEQVAQGLAAAHEKDLVHGDLSPEKVVLGPGGQVKVVDLGLSDDEGSAPYDTRTDVYRLGAMLYEMATGRPPASGDAEAGGAAPPTATVTIPPSTLNPETPAEFDRIIGACLEPDPDDRYQHTGQVAVDLGKLRRRTETAPVAVPSGEAAFGRGAQRRWTRRRLWVSASLTLAAALGVAGWQWVWPRLKPAPPFKQGDRILVADFVNETSDIELGLAIQDVLDLSGDTTLVWVPRDTTREVAALDGAAAEARCLKGECEGYLTGKVAGDPSRYRLEIALYRAGQAEPVVALSSETDARRINRALEKMIGDAGRILQRMPGVGKPPVDIWGECPNPSSGDANGLKSWRESVRAYAEDSGPERLALYERAVELDPANSAARWNMGLFLYSNLGRRSEGLSHLKEALRLLSAKAEENPGCRWNELTFEIWYLGMTWGYDAQAELVNRGVQLFPNHPGLWMQYGDITERAMGDPAAGLPHYRKCYEITKTKKDWPLPVVTPLAYALLRAGKLDEVDAFIDEVLRIPGNPELVRSRPSVISSIQISEAQVRGDDYAAILTMLERLIKEGQLSQVETRGDRAQLLAAAGHLIEAEELAREAQKAGVTEAAMSGSPATVGGYGLLDWLEKRRTGKVRALEAAERDSYLQSDGSLNDLARLSVDLGTTVSLKEVLRTVEEEQKDNRSRRVIEAIRFSRGCRALIEGRAKEAVGLLEPLARDNGPGSPLSPQHVLGRAYEATSRWADAARTYESLLAERRFWVFRTEPGVVYVLDQYRLAGFYERLGNTERARYWYGRFLNDWRNADPGTPEVEGAKKRLAALGGPLLAGT